MRLIPLCLIVLSVASVAACAPMVTSHGDPSDRILSDGPMQAGRAAAARQQESARRSRN